jgi:hypothetical protein
MPRPVALLLDFFGVDFAGLVKVEGRIMSMFKKEAFFTLLAWILIIVFGVLAAIIIPRLMNGG